MTQPPTEPLEIALLVDSERVQQWQRNALARLVEEPNVEVTTVIRNEQQTDSDGGAGVGRFLLNATERIREYPLWSLTGVGRLLTADPTHTHHVDIESIEGIADAEWYACTPRTVDEYWNTLPETAVARLAETDVAVRFGFGLLKGEALDAPTYGVVSYHLGDIRTHRGQLGGLREFLNGDDRMGVTVQRLTEELDAGEIAAIERFDIGRANTYRDVREAAYVTAETMLVPAVKAVTDPENQLSEPETVGTLYSIPTGWDVVRYAAKNVRGWIHDNVGRADGETGDGEAKRRVTPTTLLLSAGLLLATLPPLVTDQSIDDVSPKQVLGLVLVAAGVWGMLPTDEDENQRRDGGREDRSHGKASDR